MNTILWFIRNQIILPKNIRRNKVKYLNLYKLCPLKKSPFCISLNDCRKCKLNKLVTLGADPYEEYFQVAI